MHKIKLLKKIATNGERKTNLVEIDGSKSIQREFPPKSPNITHEINVLQALKGAGLKIQPEIILQNETSLAVSYVDGEPAGDSFYFSKVFMEKVSPELVAKTIQSYKNIVPKDTMLEYEKIRSFYDEKVVAIKKFWPFPEMVAKVEYWKKSFYESNLEKIKNKSYLNHNDLNPGNIIYKNNKTIGFIDWELAKMEGYYRDFASVYYAASFNEEWKEQFYKSISEIKNNEEEKMFWNQVLFSIIGDIATYSDMIKSGRAEHYKSGILKKEILNKYIRKNKDLLKRYIERI